MTTDAERAGEEITRRMAHEGLNQVQLARKADVSDVLLRELQQGVLKRRQADKLARIATALRWSTDSIDRLLAGGDAIEVPPDVPDGVSYRTADPDTLSILEEIQDLIGQLADRAREGRL